MAVIASSVGVAILGEAAVGTIGAGLLGGAVIGAGAGALYSGITGDGNILNSALTGGLIGAGIGGLGAAAGPTLMGTAGTTAPALSPALTAANAPTLTAATLPSAVPEVASGTSAFGGTGGASVSPTAGYVAPQTVANSTLLPTQTGSLMTTDAASFGPGWSSAGFNGGPAAAGLTGKEMLGYGLAGTAALSLLGGQKQPKLSTTTGTNPSYIRPYTYSQTRNPNYGQPGQTYYNQSYTAQPIYKAAEGGVIRMAQGGLPAIQTNMYPQSQQDHVQFATPTQMPTSAEIVSSDFDSRVAPYTGDAIGMARGGIARYADGGIPIDPNAQAAMAQPTVDPRMLVSAPAAPVIPSTYAPAPGSIQAVVNNDYRNILGRRPDAAGAQFHENQMAQGRDANSVRNDFLNSPENQQREALRGQVNTYNNLIASRANDEYVKGLPPPSTLPGGVYGKADIQNQITQNYQDLLGHAPDQSGLDYWTKQAQSGLGLNDIKNTIGSSNEYFKLHPEDIAGHIQSSYKNILGREADQGGMDYWANQIKNGMSLGDVQTNMKASQEATNKPQADLMATPGYKAWADAPITEANFDAARYLKENPDVANPAVWQSTPWAHYQEANAKGDIRPGYKTAFQAPAATTQSDIDEYLAANPSNAKTYNPKTQTYGSINPTIEQINAFKKQKEQAAIAQQASQNWDNNSNNAATGGLMQSYAMGGNVNSAYNLGSYSDGGRLLKGPGDGVSDDIPAVIGQNQPARLADGEFVIPARIVSEIGNGSTDAGAKRLYAMMDKIQAGRKKTIGKDNVAKDTKAKKHLLG
jgi:hypothetical protein